MKKVLAPLLALVLGFGVLPQVSQPANAAVAFPVGGLDFSNPAAENILSRATVGDFFIYENINGAGDAQSEIYAKLTVLGLTNSVADNPDLTNEVRLANGFLDEFYAAVDIEDPNAIDPHPETIRIRYSKDNGSTWTNGPTLSNLISFFEFIQLSEADQLAENLRFALWTTLSLGDVPAAPASVQVQIQVDYETEGTETWPTPSTWDDVSFTPNAYPEPNRLDIADEYTGTASRDKWIRSTFDNGAEDPIEVRIDYKIEFFDAQDLPVTFSTLSINAYDIDNAQYVEFQDVQSYSLTENTIVTSVEQVNGSETHLRFRATDGAYASTSPEDDEVHSYGEARVQANFVNASVIYLSMGTPGSGASQQFDFSAGPVWQTLAGSLNSPPAPTVISDSGLGGGSSIPVVSVVDVNPTNITVDNEIITILGANLNTVTDVYIGGVRVPIFTQSGNRLQVRAPKGLSGLVDLELKSSLNDVLMTKKLNFGGVAATGTRKTTLIVGGFAPNSRKLTARMQARIERWLDRNSDLSTLTCTGFTSLPRRTTDVTLSTNRGITACNFSKRERPELETSVSQGIEDPRPGSNVRRVRLVLTP